MLRQSRCGSALQNRPARWLFSAADSGSLSARELFQRGAFHQAAFRIPVLRKQEAFLPSGPRDVAGVRSSGAACPKRDFLRGEQPGNEGAAGLIILSGVAPEL